MQKCNADKWRFIVLVSLIVFISGLFNNLYSQGQTTVQQKAAVAKAVQPKYTITIPPSFPGGNDSLDRYLFMHIQTPDSLLSRDLSGTIYFSFLVDENGKLNKIKIEKSPKSPGWDSATISCVRQMPKWIPGKVNGVPKTMRYFLPVYFPPGHELYNLPDTVNIK